MKLRLLMAFFAGLLLTGCSQKQEFLPTVEKVDLERYKGTWYEVARYEQSFEKGCSNVTANYAFKEDGNIKVTNRCQKENGEFKESIGVARSTNSENTKLEVSFFWPFYGDYWVIMLDDEYRYAVVGNPSREYLWILSRTPKLDEAVLTTIKNKLPEFGYSLDPIVWTKQDLH